MIRHSIGIVAATAALVLGMLLPFLPGRYDNLAIPISLMSQIAARAGLLLVPIGALWIWSRHSRDAIAVAALVASSVVWIAASLGALVTSGVMLAIFSIALWIYVISRVVPRLRNLERSPAGFYLLIVPVAALLLQMAVEGPAIEFSRGRAIRNSAPLIAAIEQFRASHGRYPESLLAVNEDLWPGVVGIEKYQYEPSGDAYNLFFEQFAIEFGTREFVMYNPRDQHAFSSHRLDRLEVSPEELVRERGRGHYAVHDAGYPHWRLFLFD